MQQLKVSLGFSMEGQKLYADEQDPKGEKLEGKWFGFLFNVIN